jgi:hypothetical protein
MEIVHAINYKHNDKSYSIRFEKGNVATRANVYTEDSPDPIYSYRMLLVRSDHPDPKHVRMFWFTVALPAFDYINALN